MISQIKINPLYETHKLYFWLITNLVQNGSTSSESRLLFSIGPYYATTRSISQLQFLCLTGGGYVVLFHELIQMGSGQPGCLACLFHVTVSIRHQLL